MFKIILTAVFVGILVYVILKVGLSLLRPVFLSRFYQKADEAYNELLTLMNVDIKSQEERYGEWQSGNEALRDKYDEKEMVEEIVRATSVKSHEEELHVKIVRLIERFINDYHKQSEALSLYRRYLQLRLGQYRGAQSQTNALQLGVISFEEFVASAREIQAAVEENERKINCLLDFGDRPS